MSYLPELLTVAIFHLLAAMAPGPDFAIVTKNSICYSRKVGVYTALGIALGITVHVTYSLVGLGLIISRSILLFSILKYLGAAYLIYIGYKALKAEKSSADIAGQNKISRPISPFNALKQGFFTNALNPKATLFFFSLFTQVIDPLTPKLIQVFYGIEMTIMTFAWFGFVACVLSHQRLKKRFHGIAHYIEKTMGALFIALGIKVAISSSK